MCQILVQAVTDPCSDIYVHAYMNRPDVQEALHANVTRLDHDWESCRYVYHLHIYYSISIGKHS